MASETTVNDAILQPFLMAQDLAESQRQLIILLSEHAEPRMRGVIAACLSSALRGQEHSPDFEDLYSETKTRLVTYLHDLKSGLTAAPCRDFEAYVATIAHNACHDYSRQMYPQRARLRKKIRDLLHAHPKFALWRSQDEKRGEWLCGFDSWQGRRNSSSTAAWLSSFSENPATRTEALSSGGDIQWMKMADLLSAIFKDVGEPIRLTDVVNLVSDIRAIKDLPVASFDADGSSLSALLPDSKPRIDSVLEMRAPLKCYWQSLRQLPRDQFRVYLLYARDTSGEDLINLLLDAEITTKTEVARLLGLTRDRFLDLRWNRLPLDIKDISNELGITIDRVYKLRFWAGKRLDSLLAEINSGTNLPK